MDKRHIVRRFRPSRGRAADYHLHRELPDIVDTHAPIVPDKERPSVTALARRTWKDTVYVTAPVPRWQLDRFLGTHVVYKKLIHLPQGRMTPRTERVDIHRPQPVTYSEFLGER